jgi:hypothetical protein
MMTWQPKEKMPTEMDSLRAASLSFLSQRDNPRDRQDLLALELKRRKGNANTSRFS